jgi:hypothetical protein
MQSNCAITKRSPLAFALDLSERAELLKVHLSSLGVQVCRPDEVID